MRNQGYGDDDLRIRMKRKDFDLDDVSYELSDFSLTSPARKIRRLDAELAPIIEEEEPDVPVVLQQSLPGLALGGKAKTGVVIEEFPGAFENEERAIVLFNPMNAHLTKSPTNFSISVNPQFVSSLKNDFLCSKQSNHMGASGGEDSEQEKNSGAVKECLAVVPWVPSQLPSCTWNAAVPQTDASDMMEAEDMDVTTMEVEDDTTGFNQATGVNVNEGLHQWQQQHCLIPQPPQNTSTPIVWFR